MSDVRGRRAIFPAQRLELLMDELRLRGSVRCSEFAARLGLSDMTIRRDIDVLADRGLVTKVHGGAMPARPLVLESADEPPPTSIPHPLIGMVVPSLEVYWPEVVRGSRAAAASAGSRLLVRGASESADDLRAHVEELVESELVHGLVVAPALEGGRDDELLRWLDGLHVPVVLAEQNVPTELSGSHLESVATDHSEGARMAVRHLHAQGHTQIGLAVDTAGRSTPSVARGWRQALSALGIDSRDCVHLGLVDARRPSHERTLDVLFAQLAETRTTALVVYPGTQAHSIVKHAAARGIDLPDDLLVVAYDDEGDHFVPLPVTAFHAPGSQVGGLAVELLLARLKEGPQRPAHRVQVLPQLVTWHEEALAS